MNSEHTHPTLAHRAACPVCNPDKTVPELNEAFRTSKKRTLSIALRWKRLRVCIICWWHIRHWPMDDLTDEDWAAQLDWGSPWEVFLEGWCRD